MPYSFIKNTRNPISKCHKLKHRNISICIQERIHYVNFDNVKLAI